MMSTVVVRRSTSLLAALVLLLLVLAVSTLPTSARPFLSTDARQVENPTPITVGLRGAVDGELTDEDGGRDWHSFTAMGGINYIIELKNTMTFSPIDAEGRSGNPQYVPGHLVDPSILEVVDEQKMQVLGEHDDGGFTANFARAFFTPQKDGVYYIAVGAGAQDRGALGFYTLSVRSDDHADDYRTLPDVVLRLGESIAAMIDSDVSPDDPGLNAWDWEPFAEAGNAEPRPRRGIESLDDRDVFRFVITQEGLYRLSVSNGPTGVGIWWTWDKDGELVNYVETAPEESLVDHYLPGMYYVETGTPYESSGNTGAYTVSLEEATTTDEIEDCAPDATTRCSMEAGESKTGDIDDERDIDAWRVTLEAGFNFVIEVKGAGNKSGDNDNAGTLEDPLVYLLDSSGAKVAENNKNARIIYTVLKDASGTYYIVVSPHPGTVDSDGTYTVSVEDGAV